jgi:hypothetical protein
VARHETMLWPSQDIWRGQQERKTGDDLHTYQTVGQTDPGCCDPHAQVRVSVFHKPEGLKPQLFCYADLDTTDLHTFSLYSHQDIHPLAIFCLSNSACHVRYARRLCPKISSCSFNPDITPHRIALFVSSIRLVREAAMPWTIACSESPEKHSSPTLIGQSSVLLGRGQTDSVQSKVQPESSRPRADQQCST